MKVTIMDDLVKISQIANSLAAVTAIVVGGLWVFFKYRRGRTFARRADLNVSARQVTSEFGDALIVSVILRNSGLSKLFLHEDRGFIRVWGVDCAHWSSGQGVEWKDLAIAQIFREHEWLEPQEKISDEELVPVARPETQDLVWMAFRVDVLVFGKRRRIRGGGVKRTTAVIVPSKLQDVSINSSQQMMMERG